MASSINERPTRVRYQVMAFLCALSFLTYFDRICIMRAQEDIQRDLLLSEQQMGLILGAFWLAYALFDIPGGWLGDRFGSRFTLTRIVAAWSLFTALSGCAAGFYSLLACRFLFGVGEAGAYPNMARIQRHWLPERSRARAGGLLWLFARWGGAFSPLLFGALLRGVGAVSSWADERALPGAAALAQLGAWRIGFWISGMVGVVWCVAFYRWFRDDPAAKSTVNAAELALIQSGQPSPRQEYRAAPGMWTALFRSRSLWALAILYLCGSFGWSFFASWMPRYLKDVHGVAFAKSEWMSVLPLFCGGISCLAGGALSDVVVRRTGRRRLGRALFAVGGGATAALAMLCMRFAQTPGQAVALMCITSAAFDFGQGANWATFVDIGGEFAGTAAGFINLVGNLGNALQPFVGAAIFMAPTLGWNVLLAAYAGAYLCAAAMWLFIDPTRAFYAGGADDPGRSALDE